MKCRMRSLGCSPCTGAIYSEADTLPKIIEELVTMRRSERQNRVIDHDQDGFEARLANCRSRGSIKQSGIGLIPLPACDAPPAGQLLRQIW